MITYEPVTVIPSNPALGKSQKEAVMRVALIGNYPLHPDNIQNGPQAVFVYLLEGLRRIAGLELYVLTAHKGLRTARSFQQDGVHFSYIPLPSLPMEITFFVMRRRLHQRLRELSPDLVHAMSGRLYGCVGLTAGYPSLVTPHNIHGTEPRFAPDWIGRLRMTLHEAFARHCFEAHARHVISISPYIQAGLSRRVAARFYPVDNPVSTAFFQLPPHRSVEGRVLYVGSLRKIKRPDLALEALARARADVPGLTLHMAGGYSEPTARTLHEQIRALGLEGAVKLLGHLEAPALLREYREADLFLLTSDLETSPMVVEQAMAAGKPVIATAVGGVPYLVRDGETGFLAPPGNAEALAKALVRLATDPDLKQQMGTRAREEAHKRFHPDAVARKTYQVYRRVLHEHQSFPREAYPTHSVRSAD